MNLDTEYIIENFITQEEEKELLKLIDFSTLNQTQRSVIRYGHFMPCSDGTRIPIIPDILQSLQEKINKLKIMNNYPESVSLNCYPPNTTILPHIDNYTEVGPVVVVLGLSQGTDLLFRKVDNGVQDKHVGHSVYFPARSLFVLQGDKRYTWTHETAPVNQFRASIVFRPRI